MSKKNMARRALFASVISLILCCAMLVGTTFAWFTDSVTSGRNQIVAGNLDIELYYKLDLEDDWAQVTTETELFDDATLWEPGYTQVVYLKIVNEGTLALNYKIGLNIVDEKGAENVDGDEFKLSDYIMFGTDTTVTDETNLPASREAARAAVSSNVTEMFNNGQPRYNEGSLDDETDDVALVTLVAYMPETVGNEANYRGTAPYIKLGLNLTATQKTYENDSFDDQYDKDATLPVSGVGTTTVPTEKPAFVEVYARNVSNNAKVATFTIPAEAIDEDATSIDVSVEPTDLPANFVVEAEKEAQTYEVTVTGLTENNQAEITVKLRIGPNKSGIKLYHYDREISYDHYDGEYLIFKTTNFSPFTVEFDAVYVTPGEPTDTDMPEATVIILGGDALNEQEWLAVDLGGGEVAVGQKLAAAYQFVAPHNSTNIDNCKYKDWTCDFYVSIKLADGTVTELPAGVLFLGGNYGSFGWVGFNNPSVVVNTDLPMLQNVGGAWTYADIATSVGNFICGVNRALGADSSILDGATFTVKLCLVDPEDPNETPIPVKLNMVDENGKSLGTVTQIDYKFN
ncbi:MAG: hypothetical protein J6V25_00060 [Oscillospiraceae bacterium]|nr:hypothetical protein [Oscillospiraceae bacterium]